MRFTPAHAGNTHVNAEEAGSLEVHPRSRGEYLLTLHQTDPEPGSSPLTRGIRGPKPENVEKARFIPAHAGNTTGSSNGTRRTQVHPRSRGEYSSQHFGSCKWIGSSPLTRGIPEVCGADCTRCRFIPAHAGNTKFDGCMPPFPKVHPRSRGEYRGVFFIPFFNTGSSPLTRGILFEKVGAIGVQRFIPAHAGNTCLNSSRTASKKVHPRSRGEYDKAVTDQTHVMGSSPLTRGIPGTVRLAPVPGGFIPAHAGNTDVYSVPY